MRKRSTWLWGAAALALIGAAPAAPSYLSIERTIDDWEKPGAPPQRNGDAWRAFFDAVKRDLAAYGAAQTEDERLAAVGRLYQESVALQGISWRPAAEVREGLRAWLRPRVRLAWANRRLVETVRALGATANPAAVGNRDRWVTFVDNDLGSALRAYEAATTVRERRDGLQQVYAALVALDNGNRAHPWGPSLTLKAALDDLFNRPNLDVTADAASVSPALATNVVTSGPVDFKGQRSYVTAGPHLGFGLLPSDDGIMFSNTQALTSVTPISGFQQQVASDPKGKRAAKLYQFGATSTDHSQLTITAILRPGGLAVAPGYQHNVSAAINSNPIQGKGLGRAVASLIGLNQAKITDKVYQSAINKIVEGVVGGASELGQIKAGEGAAQKNAQLARALVGNDTLRVKNFEVTGLSLRSRPGLAMVGGTVRWVGAAEQVGADATQPAALETYQPGVCADVHLPSLATNMARGYIQSPQVQLIQNLMIVTRKLPEGSKPGVGRQIFPNTGYVAFLAAADEARAANDPKVLAVRVKRPGRSPEFSASRDGHLVVTLHDFLIEVPAPPQAARGGLAGPAARVYRISAPDAEVDIEFAVAPAAPGAPLKLTGKIAGFDPGPRAQVYAVNETEDQATPLPAFTNTIVLNVFAGKIAGQPIDAPLDDVKIPGFALTGVSPLDPSGWIRVNLSPTGEPMRMAAQ